MLFVGVLRGFSIYFVGQRVGLESGCFPGTPCDSWVKANVASCLRPSRTMFLLPSVVLSLSSALLHVTRRAEATWFLRYFFSHMLVAITSVMLREMQLKDPEYLYPLGSILTLGEARMFVRQRCMAFVINMADIVSTDHHISPPLSSAPSNFCAVTSSYFVRKLQFTSMLFDLERKLRCHF